MGTWIASCVASIVCKYSSIYVCIHISVLQQFTLLNNLYACHLSKTIPVMCEVLATAS